MVTEQLYQRKVLCGCLRLIYLWLLIAIMKKCTDRCALQLYHASLIGQATPPKILELAHLIGYLIYFYEMFLLSSIPFKFW